MIVTSQKIAAEINELKLPRGVQLDKNGKIKGAISAEEGLHRLGNRLISHYGEAIRPMLNTSLTSHGINLIQ